eukprot:8597819-Lingulodinium_polyedra.AAC.1
MDRCGAHASCIACKSLFCCVPSGRVCAQRSSTCGVQGRGGAACLPVQRVRNVCVPRLSRGLCERACRDA